MLCMCVWSVRMSKFDDWRPPHCLPSTSSDRIKHHFHLRAFFIYFFFSAGASYPPVMILHIIHTISMATPYQPCAAHGYKKYREEVEEEKTNDSSDIQYHNIKWYQFPCHRFLFYWLMIKKEIRNRRWYPATHESLIAAVIAWYTHALVKRYPCATCSNATHLYYKFILEYAGCWQSI